MVLVIYPRKRQNVNVNVFKVNGSFFVGNVQGHEYTLDQSDLTWPLNVLVILDWVIHHVANTGQIHSINW